MIIQQSNFDPAKTVKVYLTANERASLNSILNLSEELKPLVTDERYSFNELSFNWDMVTENGLSIFPDLYPITWLNSPTQIRKHLAANAKNQITIVLRRPAIASQIPYDFPRAIIYINKTAELSK